ncbi:MAG: hypothetical protein AAF514_05070 [Verrucomicrobiota bacterium]
MQQPFSSLLSWPAMAAALILASVVADAQLAPEITLQGQSRRAPQTAPKPGSYKIALENFGGKNGKEATRILGDDLRTSGYFRFVRNPIKNFYTRGEATGSRLVGTLVDPKGNIIFERTYQSNALRKSVHAFADDIIFTITRTRSLVGSQIAFVRKSGRTKEVYLCDYDGGNVRPLTASRSLAVSPSISNDRSLLTYTGYQSGYPDIYTLELPGRNRRRIVSSPGTNGGAAISPNGKQIALTMSFSGNSELYVMSSRGGRARALTKTRASESSPSWSPDGREIVFSSDQTGRPQLYRMSVSGGRPQLLRTGYAYCTEPSWSADGRRIAFTGKRGGNLVIGVLDLASGKTKQLRSGEDPSWGPDSRHLVCTSGGKLYRINADSRETTRLTNFSTISEPAWSR